MIVSEETTEAALQSITMSVVVKNDQIPQVKLVCMFIFPLYLYDRNDIIPHIIILPY